MNSTVFRHMQSVGIHVFIFACLWVMVSTNARLAAPQIFPSQYPSSSPDHVLSKVNWYLERADWTIQYAGWAVGLKNYWKMFSPVDRFNWYRVATGIYEDGKERLLPLPHQSPRNFFERNFVDFREAKFHLNMYGDKDSLRFYARYLCRTYEEQDNPMTFVKIDLHSRAILPPDEAKRRRIYYEETMNQLPQGLYECSNH